MSLTDFKKNTRNTNQGTDRGRAVIKTGIQKFGWAGAMLADKQGNILDGNHRKDIADEQGVEPLVIKTDGKRPIIVQREDVEAGSAEAVALSTLINRSADLNHRYDYSQIGEQIQEAGISPEVVGFSIEEVTIGQPTESAASSGDHSTASSTTPGGESASSPRAAVPESYQIMVECADELSQQELYDRLSNEGLKCRVLTL